MTEEISKKTLSVLVVIVVVISVLGTFMILTKNVETEVIGENAPQGKWSLTILPQEELPQQTESEGKITLTVLPQGN